MCLSCRFWSWSWPDWSHFLSLAFFRIWNYLIWSNKCKTSDKKKCNPHLASVDTLISHHESARTYHRYRHQVIIENRLAGSAWQTLGRRSQVGLCIVKRLNTRCRSSSYSDTNVSIDITTLPIYRTCHVTSKAVCTQLQHEYVLREPLW